MSFLIQVVNFLVLGVMSDCLLCSGHSGYYIMRLWTVFDRFFLAGSPDMEVCHVYLPSGLQENDPRQRRTLILTASLQTDVEVQLPPGPMEGFLVRNGE